MRRWISSVLVVLGLLGQWSGRALASDLPSGVTLTLGAQPKTLQPAGGTGTVTFTLTGAPGATVILEPRVLDDAPWLTLERPGPVSIPLGRKGVAQGKLKFRVATCERSLLSPRGARIDLGGVPVTVTQAGAPCQLTVRPTRVKIDGFGGEGVVQVEAPGGCEWTVGTSASWLRPPSPVLGNGGATVEFSADSNPTGKTRSGKLSFTPRAQKPKTRFVAVTQAKAVIEGTVAAPTFSPPAGTYTSVQQVTIASATAGAQIRYTTDGSIPTDTSGTVYTGPVPVAANQTLMAVAFRARYQTSSGVQASYSIVLDAAAPIFSPGGGHYASTADVTIASETPGAQIRYTTDGTAPTESGGTLYLGPITVSDSQTLRAVAFAPGWRTSPEAQAEYAIGVAVAQPTFVPPADFYPSAQIVTISSETPGARIRYTTDGSTPTETMGTLWTAPVTVASTETLRAVAFQDGWKTSTVSAAAYSIGVPVAAPEFSPPPGLYESAQQVTIVSATAGAQVRYATDGTVPTESSGTLYTGPVNVATSQAFKAVAFKAGYLPSDVSQVAYVIGVPLALGQSLTTAENQPVDISLAGEAAHGETLTFQVASLPAHGTLSGTAPRLAYVPASNFSGADAFTFTVNDGSVTSAPARVSLTVTAVNYAPQALAQDVITTGGATLAVTLAGSDPDGDPLTFRIASIPTYGYLSGTAPNLTYTSSLNYRGVDSFTFTAHDGSLTSAPARVSITVTAPSRVAAATFSPPGGTYASAQQVAIASATEGAQIRYTTDGTTPTEANGTLYAGPVTVAMSQTLRAVAFEEGLVTSGIAQAAYEIEVRLPTAEAGPDQVAVELSAVLLDGAASTGTDSLTSYRWSQISNGATRVAIANETSPKASFVVPKLSRDEEFVFQLEVTTGPNATATDRVSVAGRPTPGVWIGSVRGNTASYNATAELEVRLLSEPTAPVILAVASSDAAQGVPEQTSLTFTSQDWIQAQRVLVRGTQLRSADQRQNYSVLLGPAESADPLYNGLGPEAVPMEGVVLRVGAPLGPTSALVGLETSFRPAITYTGTNQLSFALSGAPEGMAIDGFSGALRWTPRQTDQGRQFSVTVSATDGMLSATAVFTVSVATAEDIPMVMDGATLRVAGSNTSLDGTSVSSPDPAARLDKLRLAIVPEASIPSLPEGIRRLSDVFVIREALRSPVTVKMPLRALLSAAELLTVNLYCRVTSSAGAEAIWSPVTVDRRFSGASEAPVLEVELAGLAGVCFAGQATTERTYPEETSPTRTVAVARVVADAAQLACNPVATDCLPAEGLTSNDKWICTRQGDESVRVTVQYLDGGAPPSEWSARTAHRIAQWAVDAQMYIKNFGLDVDKDITVSVHQFLKEAVRYGEEALKARGYISAGPPEEAKIIHLNSYYLTGSEDLSAALLESLAATVLHEYFHHAQNRSKIEGLDVVNDGNEKKLQKTSWLIEGTARWFEDYIFDEKNSYVDSYVNGRPRIMEKGLASEYEYFRTSDESKDPYERFSFFKLANSKCEGFVSRFRNILNTEKGSYSKEELTDANTLTLERLSSELSAMSCNFGDHLGRDNSSSLASAIVYYQWATLMENKMSLLDANESDDFSRFIVSPHKFNNEWRDDVADWTGNASSYSLNGVHYIPPAGAYSFKVDAIGGALPADRVAELSVIHEKSHDGKAQELIVSITSQDPAFDGATTIGPEGRSYENAWFSTKDKMSYQYNFNGVLPELFVTLVNPNLNKIDGVDPVTVMLTIRDREPFTITRGGTFRVWGTAERPGAPVRIELRNENSVPSGSVSLWSDSGGSFSTDFRVPLDQAPGVYRVWLIGLDPRQAIPAWEVEVVAVEPTITQVFHGTDWWKMEVSGFGFSPSEPISLLYADGSGYLAGDSADQSGNVHYNWSILWSATSVKPIYALDVLTGKKSSVLYLTVP